MIPLGTGLGIDGESPPERGAGNAREFFEAGLTKSLRAPCL